jgi:hypothetical protein
VLANTGRNRDAPAVTSGQLSVQGRDGGHQPLLLPRGEPSSPAGDVDASHRHQLAGPGRADAGQRHQRGPDRHPSRRVVALCQGQQLCERQLTSL